MAAAGSASLEPLCDKISVEDAAKEINDCIKKTSDYIQQWREGQIHFSPKVWREAEMYIRDLEQVQKVLVGLHDYPLEKQDNAAIRLVKLLGVQDFAERTRVRYMERIDAMLVKEQQQEVRTVERTSTGKRVNAIE